MSLILASFPRSGAHFYTQIFPSTSFRQGFTPGRIAWSPSGKCKSVPDGFVPESRAQGCETFGWRSSTCKTAKLLSMAVDIGIHVDIMTPGRTCYLLRHCHPWLLGNCSRHCSTFCIHAVVDPGNPCRDDGVSKTLAYKDERNAWGRGNKTFTASGVWQLATANDRTHA
jgi:hypothetical protein